MASIYKTPGVYREEILLKPAVRLPTGVPGFVGFAGAAGQGGPAFNTPVALHRKEDFSANFSSLPESYLAEAVTGFFDNGGIRCYVARANPSGDQAAALQNAIAALAPLEDLDLVAVPDAMSLRLADGNPDGSAIARVQERLLTHCSELGDRLAILDALPGRDVDGVLEQRREIISGQAEPINGALYFPWVKVTSGRLIPPCGQVAGVYARTDTEVGFFKAPANREILGVIDLESGIDNRIQDRLNPEGVNCLRDFPGRGIRVWGARTLSRDPNWRYINVRRLFLTLRRWIDRNLVWAAFEPNSPALWIRIQRELNGYLTTLWQAGALAGATQDQAFYVKCDRETNPPERREAGEVITELGLAPSSPAEFIIVRIIHRAGATEVA
jgi:uncharacterized protein